MNSRIVMGSAIGLAVVAVALDHTKHTLPKPEEPAMQQGIIITEDSETAPCGLDAAPCGLDSGTTPCGL